MQQKTIAMANDIQKIQSNGAKWIASDALRELTDEEIQRWLR